MTFHYTDEKNAQIILALLKANNIKKIVVSPGTTNMPIVGSVQNDSFFEVYSAFDERSAAYMAVGLATESGETVVISCTGATASRNYLSGLTEAYYRKLPIIAITSFNGSENIGHLLAQNIDRSQVPKDIARISVEIPVIKDKTDYWYTTIQVNKAILETKRHGGGPVHINLATSYKGTFDTIKLPDVQVINRFSILDEFPNIKEKKIAVFIGSHKNFTNNEVNIIEKFAELYDAPIFCDHTSGYYGKNRIQIALAGANLTVQHTIFPKLKVDLVIYIGEISGDYQGLGLIERFNAETWRVSPDGEIRDKFKTLTNVFEMSEFEFFNKLTSQKSTNNISGFFYLWKKYTESLETSIPNVPFSNLWIASQLRNKIPNESILHFGILNSLRSWNFFNVANDVMTYSNVGGFGIDGGMSTLLGASLCNSNKLYFLVIGDLAFFYDMNSLGNRHLGKNIRILLINNGGGTEFKLYSHQGSIFGDQTGNFIAASEHNINHFEGLDIKNSPAKSWSESMGFVYLSASDKDSFNKNSQNFIANNSDRPIILECFTNSVEESKALMMFSNIDNNLSFKASVKKNVMKIIPKSAIVKIKKALKGK